MIEINFIRKTKTHLTKKSATIPHSLNSGTTLIEVLMAVAFSVFVIGGGAFGVMAMMERNAMLEVRSQRRMDLDRAINYIADDIKSANKLQVNCGSIPNTAKCVLSATIPPVTPGANSTQVNYFINASTSTWIGPNTIFRNTADNQLVDGIIAPDSNELARIEGLCDPNGDKKTDLQGANGFYTCINETTDTVDLYLYGRLHRNDPTLKSLLVTTTVSARGTPLP